MQRRRFLATTSLGCLATLTGCSALPGGDSTAEPTVEISDTALRDEVTAPRLVGFSADSRVTLTATARDERDDVEWQSTAEFVTDANGRADLAEQAPVDGDYEGADPMGWLWSMEPDGDDDYYTRSGDADEIELVATEHGETSESSPSASRTVTRRHRAEGVTETTVDTDDLVGVYFEPPGDGPHPGVLALHGSGGDPARKAAELLASHGYATFAPQYFGDHQAIPSKLEHVPLEYFDAAVEWLTSKSTVEAGDVGVYGGSRGGELALLLGAHFDWPGVVVSKAGSGVAWDGHMQTDDAAWTLDGEPVPHLDRPQSNYETNDDGYYVLRGAYAEPYEEASEQALAVATIPVEQIGAPVLLISGEDDEVWPSTMFSEHAVARLRDHDFGHEFEHASYADAGHFLVPPYRPTHGLQYSGAIVVGGTPAGIATAAAEYWPKVLDYFERGLGGE